MDRSEFLPVHGEQQSDWRSHSQEPAPLEKTILIGHGRDKA
ncbi:hypothetical protein LMG27177_02092 [Paraburkholderia fynbosensis]|uniref:Uncharacterized protein n=1 Tax=Paraburkholderia fynbosensis TaxID=1200993 RepID=A0A6J5FW20_9BURK|nr:hypothetical protein LMG27177_02092 [Paraburkholderia fynbosensis]